VRQAYLACFGAVLVAAPAAAQQLQFSTVVKSGLGYGTNPFLRPGLNRGALLASISVAPRLNYATARSTTVLSADYSRDEYSNHLGHTDSLTAGINRTDQLAANLSSTLSAQYRTANRAVIADPTTEVVEDPLNIGRRTHAIVGALQLQWQPNAADQLTYGAQYQRQSYGGGFRGPIPGALASSYDQYSVNAGYSHTVDEHTSVGAQASVSTQHSKLYPDSRAIQPSLTAKRQLSAVWTADAHIGVVFQRVDGPFGGSTTSLGYGGTLCGTYPRSHVCFVAERASAPSGYGGLRIQTVFSANFDHQLDVKSRVNFAASYTKSASNQSFLPSIIPNSRAVLASGEYNHDLTQRISAGVGGRYQWRDAGGYGTAHAISGTVHITAKFGRI